MYLFLSVCLYIRQSIIPLSIRVSNYLSPLTLSMTASLHSLLFLSSPSFSQCALCQCICLCLSFCLSVFFSVCLRLQELSATDGFTSRLQQSFQHTHTRSSSMSPLSVTCCLIGLPAATGDYTPVPFHGRLAFHIPAH